MNINPWSNLKARTKLLYFALTEATGSLLGFCVLVGESAPDWLHD